MLFRFLGNSITSFGHDTAATDMGAQTKDMAQRSNGGQQAKGVFHRLRPPDECHKKTLKPEVAKPDRT
ncbi:hypothetical protein CDU01_20310 [Cronobacter sakazakii]|nr:hypothetical protein [Salmonella enterica subsp. enterica serovar Oranienburg]PQV67347.1 hypothetical protein CDU01_20310 [Cronobacter sakazakii]